VDSAALRHIGIPDPAYSEVVKAAHHWFGKPVQTENLRGNNKPIAEWRGPLDNSWRAFCHLNAWPAYQLMGQRGAVFTMKMDAAFPECEPPSCLLGIRRWAVRKILGLR